MYIMEGYVTPSLKKPCWNQEAFEFHNHPLCFSRRDDGLLHNGSLYCTAAQHHENRNTQCRMEASKMVVKESLCF